MKLWGSRQRLWFGGWLMAAVGLLGLNGFHLMALENQQMVGHSPTIKALRANLIQWENTMMAPMLTEDTPFKPLLARYPEPPTRDTTEEPSATSGALPIKPPTAIALPVLKGMLRKVDRRGRQSYWAVLDGRVYQQDERIGEFVVLQVSRDGVILGRNGQQWHLDCPTPTYSEERGD